MAKYGVPMLETLILRYCSKSPSSRGMRVFLDNFLPTVQKERPDLQIKKVLRGGQHPFTVGLYRNGRSKPICVKNLTAEEIEQHVFWLCNSHGRGMEYKVVRSRHLSRNPSIQGHWTADTFAGQVQLENEQRRIQAAQMAAY